MAQVVESGSIQLDTNSNIVPAGSFQLDGAKPMFEETPFKGQHPNIYAGLKTAADMVPYMKYVDPEERERFNQLATNQQTRELLIENLYTVVGMGLPTIGKSVASVVSPLAERLLPKTFKMLTKERTFGKVTQPEVKVADKPIPETSPVTEPKPIAQPKVVKAKSIELDKPEVKVEPKVEPKIEPVVEPKVIPAESIKLDAPEVKAEVKPVEYVDKPTERMVELDAAGLYDPKTKISTVLKRDNQFTQDWVTSHEEGHRIYDRVRPESVAVDMQNNPILWEQAKKTGAVKSSFIRNKNEKYGAEGVDWIEALADMEAERQLKPERYGKELNGYLDSLKTDLPSAETVTPPVKPTVAEVKGSADLKGNGEYQAPAFPNRTFDIVKGAKGEGWIIKEGYTGLPMPQSSSLKGILKTKQDAIDHIKNNFGLTPEQIKYNIEQGTLSDKSILWNKGKITEQTKKPEPKGVQLNSGLDPTIALDIMKTVSAKTSEIIEANKMTPSVARGVKAGKDAMIEHHRNLRRAESTSKLFEKTVNDIVPDPKRQMMMVHAYESKMRGKYWGELTEIEKGVVRWIAQEKAKLGQYIKSNKILETMPENENINHIYHHWINKETGEPYQAMYGRFSKGLPQAKQRVIPTYEKGIENGMTPATTNIGKLVGLELESVTRANNARQLFKTLHGIKGDESMSIILSKGGKPKPIRMVESWSNLEKQGLTDGYIRYDNSYLDTAMTFESTDGRLVTMKGAVGVKEELHPFVRSYLESPTYGKLSELNFAAKSLKLGASLFHVVSLGMQELANMRIPFVHIPKGLRLIKELSPETRLLHQEGLELFKGYEDLGFQDKFFDNATKLGKVGNAITVPISLMRDFIFKYVQPGMKASFADMQFRKLLPQYLKDTGITAEEVMKLYEQGKPLPPEALRCAREVVQKADGHFSGEDFKRSMLETNRFMVKAYFTPEARKAWQAALLSPTWQREHLIVAKNVAKSFMPDKAITKLGMAPLGPIKSQYRKYALGAIMMVGSVDMWNYMSTQVMDGEGKHLWENPTGKGFAVRAWWDEPAYTMKTKNGQDRYIPSAPAYIRPLKSVFEVAEWVHDPVLKASYKFSPVVAAIGEQLFGQKRYVGLPDIPERAKDFIIDSATPIVVDQWVRTAQGKQSAYATAMPFFGMPVSRLRERDNTYKIKYKDSSAQ